MVERDDDDEVDLGISLETVATIVDHARALQAKATGEAEQISEGEDSEAAMLREHPEDVTEDALRAFINDLNEDEQAALIALAWVGRGDYDASEWEEALRLARERGEGRDTAEYLLNMDMLGDLLAEGVAAFGLSIEEVDR
ncbi:hypothetical protein GCM10010964_01560 [Caldovatus sediminis]|uniref:DUF3775 domain-containing protein n=1 Tax=Caldovatus sediminis TaxID=2041189 RepID=A0A8J3E9T5_9PROT|nr:DUF3775 domain-containing protein [Caldovatus sediminis]GGG16974.1 hypothetical protein GCM10010964_01560 [Caldovatus sediminis]